MLESLIPRVYNPPSIYYEFLLILLSSQVSVIPAMCGLCCKTSGWSLLCLFKMLLGFVCTRVRELKLVRVLLLGVMEGRNYLHLHTILYLIEIPSLVISVHLLRSCGARSGVLYTLQNILGINKQWK